MNKKKLLSIVLASLGTFSPSSVQGVKRFGRMQDIKGIRGMRCIRRKRRKLNASQSGRTRLGRYGKRKVNANKVNANMVEMMERHTIYPMPNAIPPSSQGDGLSTKTKVVLGVAGALGTGLLVGGAKYAVDHLKSDGYHELIKGIPDLPGDPASYLTNPKISEAQKKAYEISNSEVEKNGGDHAKASISISSNRYSILSVRTDIEKLLDNYVYSGDKPLPDFTYEQLQNAAVKVVPKEGNINFVLCKDSDAIHLHDQDWCQDGDIVSLASQFNALESMDNKPSPVKEWCGDHTQGPQCALQSIAACKHREAAHLEGKLPDALEGVLEKCIVGGKPITSKYPHLYQNGYLEMMEITEEEDMKVFLDFLNSDILEKNMKVLMQWVKCEGTGKTQLQFFTAAPSFQNICGPLWEPDKWGKGVRERSFLFVNTCQGINKSIEFVKMVSEACVRLVKIQYKAMGQAARIISNHSGEKVRLHVSMIGAGAFNNPVKMTVPAAIEALREGLGGTDATVILHSKGKNIWADYLKNNSIYYDEVEFAKKDI